MERKPNKYKRMTLDEGDLAQLTGGSKHNLTYEQLFPPADPLTLDQAQKQEPKKTLPKMMGLND